jgi:YHS domain-containing protein
MTLVKVFLAPLMLTLMLCASSNAQNAAADTAKPALKGYDVVAYFNEHKPAKGSPDVHVDFDGMRYYFSTARNRAAFDADPDRFMPQFGGYCAMGVSKGKRFEADPTVFRIIDGKLYVFSGPKASDAVDQDPELLARARQAWEAMK